MPQNMQMVEQLRISGTQPIQSMKYSSLPVLVKLVAVKHTTMILHVSRPAYQAEEHHLR